MKASTLLAAVAAVSLAMDRCLAGAYIFADGSSPDRITHPTPYMGLGGDLTVSVCIATDSESIDDIETSIRNSVDTWNELEPASPNLFLGNDNEIEPGQVDFESTLVHEVGHCLGLAHPNLATESGLPAADRDYTKAARGPNNNFDIDPGPDGIKGSADDLRGDDINLHWFALGSNNPFVLTEPVDATTYSRELNDLPGTDSFAANADRSVGASLGFAGTEAVMQQGAFTDEDQRQLGVDDVATLRLAMAGVDREAGTADDYRPVLEYGGVDDGCDITVRVTGTSFAFCSVGGQSVAGNPNHFRVTNATVQLGSASEFNWFFSIRDRIFDDGFES